MDPDPARGTVTAAELAGFFGETLDAGRFADYCPNGLQVEGTRPIARLVSGVTASLAFLRRAVEMQADAVLVHHGWFWRGEDPRVIGARRERMRLVLEHGLALFAYHLPLDAHPTLGNNARLAAVMGWRIDGRGGEHDLVFWHDLPAPVDAHDLAGSIETALHRSPLMVGAARRPIRRIAWCTGAAHDWIGQAIALGADAYVSGEIAERTTHEAREAGIVYLAAGHHATERYGVQALGIHAAAHFGIEHRFVDDDNPV